MLHNTDMPLVAAPTALHGRDGDIVAMRVEELADEELRLLLAVGDHALPVEIRERLAAVHERRALAVIG